MTGGKVMVVPPLPHHLDGIVGHLNISQYPPGKIALAVHMRAAFGVMVATDGVMDEGTSIADKATEISDAHLIRVLSGINAQHIWEGIPSFRDLQQRLPLSCQCYPTV